MLLYVIDYFYGFSKKDNYGIYEFLDDFYHLPDKERLKVYLVDWFLESIILTFCILINTLV